MPAYYRYQSFIYILFLLLCIGCTSPRDLKIGPLPVSSGIRFRLFYPEAETISIAGSFNNWNPAVHFLSENPSDYWTILLSLPKGRYQYMFVIDQQIWIHDPGAEMIINDGFGQKNSLLVVE